MNDFSISQTYLQRVFAIQVFAIIVTFFAVWLTIGGLIGAVAAGLICGANALSLKVLLELIRQSR